MSNNRYRILLIEDESSIRNFVKTILDANDYQVLTADSYQQGVMMFSSHVPDLVLLDLGLPDRDGLDFIRHIRKESTVPVLVLSARTQEADKVQALDLGANDYITKPFGTQELLARVRAALRNRRLSTDASGLSAGKFHLEDLVIDYDRRLVSIADTEIKLTQTEYNILAYLSQHTGKVLTYSVIIGSIWGRMDEGSVKKLQVNMANIRKKLSVKPGDTRYIINELGVGYRMQDPQGDADNP